MKKLIQLLFIAIFASTFYHYVTTHNAHACVTANIFYLMSSLSAVLAGIYVVRIFGLGNKRGNIFLLITFGALAWFIGDFLFSTYAIIYKADPFPSYIDLIYIAGYPLFFFGFLGEYKLGKITWTKPKKIMTFLLISTLLIITAYFVLFQAYSPNNALWENVFGMLYGLSDIILAIVVVFLLLISYEFKEGKLFRPWLYIFFSMLFTVIGDVLYAIYFNQYEEGIKLAQYIDLIYVIGFLFLAYGLFLIGFTIKEIQNKIPEKL